MNIMLTGNRGSGKTTAIVAVRAKLPMVRFGGYLCHPVLDVGATTAHAMSFFGGGAVVIAQLGGKGPRVGRFAVMVDAFERHGVAALRRAQRRAELIVLDEIGRFEVHAPRFVEELHACLDAPTPVLGVLSAHGGPVVEAIAARPDVRLVPVEKATRDLLPDAIVRALLPEVGWEDMYYPRLAAGVILAGGEGSRLQSDKGFLKVGGRPMVHRVRDVLGRAAAQVLVAGPEGIAERIGLHQARDLEGCSGPLAGIAGGLAESWDDRVLVCAWDMPFVDAALGLHMLMLAEDEGFDAVAPRTPDGPEPLFAVYGQSCREAMAQVIEAGGRRPVEVLERVNTRWVEGPELAVFGDPKVTLMSVNTPEDLERAREIAGG